jgi:nucleoside-diphosphate-sugar epimerase
MESDQGNLLVIGARSLVGRRLREAVTGPEGWKGEVRFTSRQQLANQSLVLDFTNPEAFRPGMAFENVIFCTPVWLGNERLFQHLKSLGMRRLVAFSSTSLFTKETSGNEAERGVVRQLLDGEKSTIDFCRGNGVAWTILRPTLIYDEGQDENVSRIASTIRKLGFFPVCPPASGLRQPVHARDLAVAALKALRSKPAEGHAYNLAGGESLTYRAMVARIFDAMGRRPAIVALPEGAWRLMFGVLRGIQPHRDLKQNLDMVLRMNRDLWFDSAQATRDFGYTPEPFKPNFTAASGR